MQTFPDITLQRSVCGCKLDTEWFLILKLPKKIRFVLCPVMHMCKYTEGHFYRNMSSSFIRNKQRVLIVVQTHLKRTVSRSHFILRGLAFKYLLNSTKFKMQAVGNYFPGIWMVKNVLNELIIN